MNRLGRVMLAIVSALLLAPLPAHAAAPSFGWRLYQFNPPDQPVEQQSDWPFDPTAPHYVTNPTTCGWDVDDLQQWLALPAPLKAGQSASMTACMVSDASSQYRTVNGLESWWSQAHGMFGTRVSADAPGIVTSVCYSPQGVCLRPVLRRQPDGSWLGTSCSQAVYAETDATVPVVAGSTGRGVVTTITVTVTNTASKTVRKVVSDNQIVGVSQQMSSATSGCYSDSLPMTKAYPLAWNVS